MKTKAPKISDIIALHSSFVESDEFGTDSCTKHGTVRPCRHCNVEWDTQFGIDPFCIDEYQTLAEKVMGMTVSQFAQEIKRVKGIFVNAGVLPLMTDAAPHAGVGDGSRARGIIDAAVDLASEEDRKLEAVGNKPRLQMHTADGDGGMTSNGAGGGSSAQAMMAASEAVEAVSDSIRAAATRTFGEHVEDRCNTEAPEPDHRIITQLPLGTSDQAWAPPMFVTIVGRTYVIEWKANKDDVKLPDGTEGVGVIDNQNLVIKIWTGMRLQLQRETLIHEIMHGALSVTQTPMSNLLAGRDRIDVIRFEFDEFYVEALDAVLLATLRANPQVTGWLLAHIEGEDVVTTATFTTTEED